MKELGILTATLLVATIKGLVGAYVAITLYRWFMLPIGAPNLTTGQLYGALFFLSYIRYKEADLKDEEEDKPFGEKLFTGLVRFIVIACLSLGVGWVIHTILY